jgi:hypothetical protein
VKIKNSNDTYWCSIHGQYHMCVALECSNEYQIDSMESNVIQSDHNKWYCPLSKQSHYYTHHQSIQKHALPWHHINHYEDLQDPEDSQVQLMLKQLSNNSRKKPKKTSNQPLVPSITSDQRYIHYYCSMSKMKQTLQEIFTECRIMEYFPQEEIDYIVRISIQLYLCMITTTYWNKEEHLIYRDQYNECYHFYMVLYNMRHKDGLSIPTESFQLDAKEEDIKRALVVPYVNKVSVYFPNEKDLRLISSKVLITQSTTLSNRILKYDNLYTSNSTSSRIQSLIQPINHDHFTHARLTFHCSLTEYIRIHKKIPELDESLLEFHPLNSINGPIRSRKRIRG